MFHLTRRASLSLAVGGAAALAARGARAAPLDDLIGKARQEGTVNSVGMPDDWANWAATWKDLGEKYGLKPRARILGMASIGSEPTIMLTGPSFVTEKVLKRLGMTTADIDLFELNEAFASVVLRYMQAMKIDHDKINVNGGAIAMGHPLGATGGMILGTVLDELERTGKSTALVTLCVGAGMGTATVIERI